jgi:hypothetical protein
MLVWVMGNPMEGVMINQKKIKLFSVDDEINFLQQRMKEIKKLSLRESPLGLLRAPALLDDDEK